MATDTVSPDALDAREEAARAAREEGVYVKPHVDVTELRSLLDGRYADVRELVRGNLSDYASILTEAETLSQADYRERVKDVVLEMAASGQTGLGFPEEYGGGGDIGASLAAFETLALGDLSVLVKVGVQFGLFGGAILQLGTERHHERYLADLITGKLMGCFAMTETGHGSNVQALGTIATYDPATEEFVIETTSEEAGKDYIGNAAVHGELAVVFARLEVGGQEQGVHAFVVPIRSGGEPCDGVRIEDDGLKMGLNGVDNGRLWFSGVRVPREALLNRFADVTPSGDYTSDIESANKRFFTTLGTLVQGRVCVGGAGINASKVAIAIAIKYALRRRQFEATSETEEELILDYGLHQRRLFPLLARTYALHFAQEVVAGQVHEIFSGTVDEEIARRQLESRAAGTKALGTWHATRTIQECREACGGAGYLAENRFAALKADTDVFTTFEGDNHVLMQLVAKGLLTDYSSGFEEMDQFGMVKFVAELGVETIIEKTGVHKLLERIKDVLPGRRRGLGPGGGPARPRLPADDAALPRGAHALGSGAPPQARDRPGDEPGRGLLPGPGPRDRLGARAHGAAGARGLRRQGARPSGGRPAHHALAAVRPARAVRDRGRPGVVHGARSPHDPAQQGDQPRDQQPVPQGPAAGG